MSSLPSFLFSSYKQYKADTNILVDWLVRTAKQCGYQDDDDKDGSLFKKQKLKGRARKLARDAATANKPLRDGDAQTTPKTTHVVKAKDYVPMAKCIVSFEKPPVEISAPLWKIAQRAIKARKACAAWFQSDGCDDGDHGTKNEAHLHFVTVLEETLGILEKRLSKPKRSASDPATDNSKTTSADSPLERMQNMFDVLSIDEPAANEIETVEVGGRTEGIEQPSTPTQERATIDDAYVAEEPQTEEQKELEFLFASFCLFADLNKLRHRVKACWADYNAGKANLVTAAVITNTAMELARRLEEDFRKYLAESQTEHLRLMDQGSLCRYLYTYGLDLVGVDWLMMPRGQRFDWETYELAEYLFVPWYEQIVGFCTVYPKDSLPTGRVDVSKYDPNLDHSKLSARQRYEQNRDLLQDSLILMAIYAAMGSSTPEDELIKGIRDARRTRKVPLWLGFGAQVYLDIHDLMRRNPQRAFEDMRFCGQTVFNSIDRIQRLEKQHSKDTKRTMAMTRIDRVADCLDDWVLTDFIGEHLRCGLLAEGSIDTEPYQLLSTSPLLSGTYKFSVNMMATTDGIRFANERTMIMLAAHLYNAVRQCTSVLSDTRWEDMDLLLSWHMNELFVGTELPTTIESCAKNTTLMLGVSADSYARNRRHHSAGLKSKQRFLTGKSELMEIFVDRYTSNGSTQVSVSQAEALLSKRTSSQTKTATTITPTLSVHQFLSILQTALNDPPEPRQYTFSYLSHHTRCTHLLTQILHAVNPLLDRLDFLTPSSSSSSSSQKHRLDHTPSFSDAHASSIFAMHGSCLLLATDPSSHIRKVINADLNAHTSTFRPDGTASPASLGIVVDTFAGQQSWEPLEMAGRVMKEFIEREGRAGIREVESVLGGGGGGGGGCTGTGPDRY